jgi:hypothetical protein
MTGLNGSGDNAALAVLFNGICTGVDERREVCGGKHVVGVEFWQGNHALMICPDSGQRNGQKSQPQRKLRLRHQTERTPFDIAVTVAIGVTRLVFQLFPALPCRPPDFRGRNGYREIHPPKRANT